MLEEDGNYAAAVRLYETMLSGQIANAEIIVEAMILAFQMTDYGFVVSNGLPLTALEDGSRLLHKVYQYGDSVVGGDPEYKFWRTYTEKMLKGDVLPTDFCRICFEGGCEDAAICYDSEVGKAQLRQRYGGQKTARAQYVLSLV